MSCYNVVITEEAQYISGNQRSISGLHNTCPIQKKKLGAYFNPQ